MGKLLTNIRTIYCVENGPSELKTGAGLSEIKSVENGWILIDNDHIERFGTMDQMPDNDNHEVISLSGHSVMPAFCDSHTHLVFAEPRNNEYEDRIRGLSYEEIAKRGGGILNSAEKLRKMSEDELFEASRERLRDVIRMGTGAIEIKSGYGLSMDAELKMLRVIQRLRDLNWIPIKASFLGAHALPLEFKNDKPGYMKLLLEELLPEVANHGLADYVDIFCEDGYFDLDDTRKMLEAGLKFGLKGKIHVNQFNVLGGVRVATDNMALSVDHLEQLEEDDIEALKNSTTLATLLPGCSFFLGIPYAPARRLLNAGLPIALASDFNPGSAPSGNMGFVMALGCIKQRLLPEESLNACTLNGAFAMELEDRVGSISIGKKANLIVTEKIDRLSYFTYAFGECHIHRVMINGAWFE